jgi:hypothetical protein
MGFLANWRPRHLIGAWGVYWLGLGVATLGDAAVAIRRVLQAPTGEAGVSLSYGDDLITLVTTSYGQPVWTGAVAPTTLALALAGPPLLLWLVWLVSRPKRDALATGSVERATAGREPDLLDASPASSARAVELPPGPGTTSEHVERRPRPRGE